jgi:hypothetical protein
MTKTLDVWTPEVGGLPDGAESLDPGDAMVDPNDMLNRYLWVTHGLYIHWIGLRENLQETMVFIIKYRAFL